MCQPMPTGLYTCWSFDSETSRFKPRGKKTSSYENMVMSYFQQTISECEIESFTTGKQNKIDFLKVDVFCSHCNTVFEYMGCSYHFCSCGELYSSLTEDDVQRGGQKEELDALRRHYTQKSGFEVIEVWECQWWEMYKTTNGVEQNI